MHMMLACAKARSHQSCKPLLAVGGIQAWLNHSDLLFFNCCINTTNGKHTQRIHYGSVMLGVFFSFLLCFLTADSSLRTALEVPVRIIPSVNSSALSCLLLRAWVTTTCCPLYSFSSRILTLMIYLLTTKHCLVESQPEDCTASFKPDQFLFICGQQWKSLSILNGLSLAIKILFGFPTLLAMFFH